MGVKRLVTLIDVFDVIDGYYEGVEHVVERWNGESKHSRTITELEGITVAIKRHILNFKVK